MLAIGKISKLNVDHGNGRTSKRPCAEIMVEGRLIQFCITNEAATRDVGEYALFSFLPESEFCRYVPLDRIKETT